MADDWYMIELGAQQIRAGELERIRAEFSTFFLLREPGTNMAVFTRRARSGSCEVYFAPDCRRYTDFIFERHPAVRTRAPGLLGTTLLVGHPTAVSPLLGRLKRVISLTETLRAEKARADFALDRLHAS